MGDAKRDNNYVTSMLAVSNADASTPVVLYADPSTHRLLTDASFTVNDGGTSANDSGAFQVGSSLMTPVGGLYASSITSVSDGDVGAFAMTAARGQHVYLVDASGNAVSISGGTQYAQNSVAFGTQTVTLAGVVRADTAATQVDADGDRSVLIVDANGRVHANVGNVVTVTGTVSSISNPITVGTVTNVVSIGTLANVTTIGTVTTVAVLTGGGIAHDGADSGNPVKIGAKAETSPKGITAVADGDRTDLYADADGIQMVKLNTSGADLITDRMIISGTTTATAFANFGAVANTYNYVTTISVYNQGGTTTHVDFLSGAVGTTLWTMAAPSGGGSVLTSSTPIFKTAVGSTVAVKVGTVSTVYVCISGFQSKV